jgi:hypothetical protein
MMAIANSFIESPRQQYLAGDAVTTTADDLLRTPSKCPMDAAKDPC